MLTPAAVRRVVKTALLRLPAVPALDRLSLLATFWVAHHRLPRRDSGLFNDYLYFLRTRPGHDLIRRQFVSDKSQAKIYCRGVLGVDITPKTFAVVHRPEDITADSASHKCVIKPTHLSAKVIYHPGGQLSDDRVAEIRQWLAMDIYKTRVRNPNYKGIRPGVIFEEVVAEPDDIKDFKVHCFQGRARAVQVDSGRRVKHHRALYSLDWEQQPYRYNKPLGPLEPRPEPLDQILEYADALSSGFDFLRVDFYITPGRVWFGEFASYPSSGHGRFEFVDARHRRGRRGRRRRFGSVEAERAFSRLIFG